MNRIRYTRGKKPGTLTYRSRKSIKERDVCFNCKKEFFKYELEVEHDLPVCLGGDPETWRLFCKDCHKEKTEIDATIIAFFKQLNFINKVMVNEYETPLELEELKRIYFFNFNMAKAIKEKKDITP